MSSDIQGRLDAINASTAPVIEEYARLTYAVNKAITLVLTLAAVGVLTFVSFAPTEQRLKKEAIINQENVATAKGAASWH